MLATEALARVRTYLDEATPGLWLDSELYHFLSDGQMTYKIDEKYTNADELTSVTKIAIADDIINIVDLWINDHLYKQHALGEKNLMTYGYYVHDGYIVPDYEITTIEIGDFVLNCIIHPAVIELDGEDLVDETLELEIPENYCMGIIFYAVAQAYLKDQELQASANYLNLYMMDKIRYEEYGLKAPGELTEDSYEVGKLSTESNYKRGIEDV